MAHRKTAESPKVAGRDRLTVLDLFCGAGGFSEGFRSAGCQIVAGIDHWQPAVETFNCNFGLNGKPIDISRLEGDEVQIEQFPDTDIIIGSPPCVSFSYSNQLGNADKTEGLRLIKVFFSIVAVKKFKRGSRLVAWYMENVPNAIKSLSPSYNFADLGLSRWATRRGLAPKSVAITVHDNALVLNAADVGVAQTRKRLFIGEIIGRTARRRGFDVTAGTMALRTAKPVPAHSVRSLLPAPNCAPSYREVRDPIHRAVRIPLKKLTDHFYETGAYESHWRDSKALKISHPYMGRMAFPENETKPSRTIVATPFPRSREALLYKSEWNRAGNGKYRGPTVREAATLMSFPITFQFIGTEGAKWRLVGNAVCPLVSRALAVRLLKTLGFTIYYSPRTALPKTLKTIPNLNTFSRKTYDKPPKRRNLARFRSHALKSASMTVALANYDVTKRKAIADGRWRCFVTYGIGQGYKIQRVYRRQIQIIRRAIEKASPTGVAFTERITNGFSSKIPPGELLQKLYERNVYKRGRMLNPNALLEEVGEIVTKYAGREHLSNADIGIFLRDSVPMTQLYALFGVCHIVSTAESKRRLVR
jgi:DNA (cytosine-5)-methyltransferase 1